MWFIIYDEDSLRHVLPPINKRGMGPIPPPLACSGRQGWENLASPIHQTPF